MRYLAFSAAIVVCAFGAVAQGRDVVSLDGTWQFKVDPENAGEGASWFGAQEAFSDSIQVPGAWDAQGFGAETDKLKHNFIGKAWYKRAVPIPAAWEGRRVFVCIGGVHRYAKVWVNGQFLGEHIGYLSPFEYDVTPHVKPGTEAVLAICVDSVQRWDVDALTGCYDIIDYMDLVWGGIWGHVSLEARSAAYLENIFVQPKIAPPGCRVSAGLVGDASACDAVRLEVLDPGGKIVAKIENAIADAKSADAAVALVSDVPRGALWTPNTPVLYVARLSLLKGGTVIDHVETRFGLRKLELDGPRILLNGKRVFLHGYGDDAIYPETMAGPSDKEYYLKRLRLIKEYGFNHVRHHSHFLPPEYYEACDEVGMLVSAEFPIAYKQFYEKATGPALELYKTEWAAVIKRFRNHPSIFDWSMANEMYSSFAIAPELYRTAKELDGTRPVVDTDGFWATGLDTGERDRDILDLYFAQFDVFNTPLDKPDKFACANPRKPVISHETGNYVTFPRLDMIDLFQDNFKPFWLLEAKAKLEKLGLLDENELWALNSERLYYLCHKVNIEAMRKNPMISGHHWWLFQDYWTTTNGLVDTYFRPKPGITPEQVRRFVADVVVLQDGIGLTYRAGENVDFALLVSNYSPEALSGGTLHWRITADGAVLDEQEKQVADAAQGDVVELARVTATLPQVEKPARIVVEAELRVGEARYGNEWSTWAYPSKAPEWKAPVWASADLLPTVGAYGIQAIPADGELPDEAAYVGSFLTKSMFDAMTRGACVLLVQPPALLPTAMTRFKTAWWHGNEGDNTAGTVVYDHPVVRPMAPEGWCDAGWYRLLENSHGYILNDLPAQPEVLVRGVEVCSACRNKAMLFQAKVGQGSLIVCGLNLFAGNGANRAPEAEWLTARLLEYASTLPKPAAELPADFLREKAAEVPSFEGPFVEGFARLVRNEGEEADWFTFREARGKTYTCRQTEKGHVIEWETATVPEKFEGDSVTFVFAGAVGWRSQPETNGFTLTINGKDAVDFDVAPGFATWKNDKLGVTLTLFSKTSTKEDNAGLFYLRAPVAMLAGGKPCRFAVHSNSKDSQRWFALHPYTDLLTPPAP